MFVALGLSAVFPILHGLKLYGFQQMCRQMGLLWVVLQGALYIIGAGLYAVSIAPGHGMIAKQLLIGGQARIPERWHPGRYDVIGSSHQIFHIFVVLAAVSHLMGLLKAFDYRHAVLGGICT
jgi:adiponectin receptor